MAECQRCPFQQIVDGLTALTKTYKVEPRKYGDPVLEFNPVGYLAYRSKNQKIRKMASEFNERYDLIVKQLESSFLPFAQKICYKCSSTSNDDNPSNHGMTFVSMDAMPTSFLSSNGFSFSVGDEPEEGGKADAPDSSGDDEDAQFFSDMNDEDGTSGASPSDWINTNRIQVTQATDEGCTNLPSHIEDLLRKVLKDFGSLGITDQNFVLQQMTGQSLQDFASMNWVPDEMKSRQTKQWASGRWNRIVKNFPIAKVLRKERPLKDMATERSHAYAGEHYIEQSFDFGNPLAQN